MTDTSLVLSRLLQTETLYLFSAAEKCPSANRNPGFAPSHRAQIYSINYIFSFIPSLLCAMSHTKLKETNKKKGCWNAPF